jgi:hypothetical protein
MSLTGKIMSLFADKEKSIPIFPRTKVKAISDDNGVGLDAILDGMSNDLNTAIDKLSEVAIEYTAIISPTWTGSAAPYTQEIAVAGLLEGDDPITDVIVSDDYTTAQLQLEEWAKIYRIEIAEGKLIVYANEPTTVSLNIQMVVSRDKVIDTEVEGDNQKKLNGMVNPNLLDNWYFGNPVNQRGQTEYTAAGYTIDRWRVPSAQETVKI